MVSDSISVTHFQSVEIFFFCSWFRLSRFYGSRNLSISKLFSLMAYNLLVVYFVAFVVSFDHLYLCGVRFNISCLISDFEVFFFFSWVCSRIVDFVYIFKKLTQFCWSFLCFSGLSFIYFCLIFVISFLLPTLGLVWSHSGFLRYKVGLFIFEIFIFVKIGLYCYNLHLINAFITSHESGMLCFLFQLFQDTFWFPFWLLLGLIGCLGECVV